MEEAPESKVQLTRCTLKYTLATRAGGPRRHGTAVSACSTEALLWTAVADSSGPLGRRGEGPGEFGGPDDICVWRDGTVFVADRGRGTYVVFAPGGSVAYSDSAGYSIKLVAEFERLYGDPANPQGPGTLATRPVGRQRRRDARRIVHQPCGITRFRY